MIPIAPAALLLAVILLGLGLLGALGLIALALSLLLASGRARLRKRWKTYSALVLVSLVLATPAALMTWHLYLQSLQDAAREKALNPRLREELLLGEISFPAGTRVRLQRAEPATHWRSAEPLAYGLQTLDRALFDTPVRIRGLDVDRLDAPASHFFTRLRLSRDQAVDSWPCAGGREVEFQRQPAERLHPSRWRFRSCTLQAGALLAGVVWPSGSQLYQTESGWSLQTEQQSGEFVEYRGMALHALRVALQQDARLHYWDGQLARATRLGPMQYGTGTRVRGFANGDLRFTPTEADAVDATGRTLPAEHSVFQSAAGEVTGIRPNEQAGVIDWMRFSAP